MNPHLNLARLPSVRKRCPSGNAPSLEFFVGSSGQAATNYKNPSRPLDGL